MKLIIIFLSLIFIANFGHSETVKFYLSPHPKSLVVLIPGTWNSLLPGNIRENPVSQELEANSYFSLDVVNTLVKSGHGVLIVNKLSPFGDFNINADRTIRAIQDWYLKFYPKKDMPITLLGHSAGGLYALKTANVLWEFPIRNVILIATPLNGSPVAEKIFEGGVAAKILRETLERFSNIIDFNGVTHLTKTETHAFLDQLRIPENIQIIASTGSQPAPEKVQDYGDSLFLSPLFQTTALAISESSDGVVPLSSAFGEGTLIKDTTGNFKKIISVPFLSAHLDHAEQFLDVRIFHLMGFRNTDELRSEQISFYNKLIKFAAFK